MEKTKTTSYTTFKTDITKVVLVFLISNFFTYKNFQGRKLSVVNALEKSRNLSGKQGEESMNEIKCPVLMAAWLNPT